MSAGSNAAGAGAVARPSAPARLSDVAAAAGVSIKTVSRVVNDEPGVLRATQERVLEAIRELGFVPNTMARSLKTGGQDAIGVVIDAIGDPFFAAIVSVIEELALEQGMNVVFASTSGDPDRERDQLLRLAGYRLRGLIVTPTGEDASLLQQLRRRMPVVCLDSARTGLDSVVVDDYSATRDAVERLIAVGHERIAFIGYDELHPQTTGRRYTGFADALGAAGLTAPPHLTIDHRRRRIDLAATVGELLSGPEAPTAVFCATARSAIATLDAIQAGGHRDVALISFGDFELASVFTPGVTCVDHDPRSIASVAFARLMELVEHPGAQPSEIVVPVHLVPRGSGELPPADRALSAQSRGVS
ncbi:LacI family DNA-binding transcriptional regulator [Leucobacter sp. CSA1]|uniref:LacI family DNA-binding transcriptional regulator n=1 Tax=Leucobacter chromiisoli TaxID=2796471 RepID=A0A934Q5P5_9MICO|nr:LacI family DNA-binding transcriptional regulator [Leucobacter chromiisoli]MBK0417526.1 LacI family DNA-binding transcriptional regulator [Leucobacter chromiisoli]